jgi:HEPN domain-containing protein
MTQKMKPSAYSRAARDFYVAASHLLNYTRDTPLPTLFLIGRSIELSLKALLIQSGIPAISLAKKPYGHDLSKLLDEACERGLIDATFLPTHQSSVELLSKEYKSTTLSYVEEHRTYLLPRIDLIDEAACRLLELASKCSK